jgi:protein phosphatase 1 regulatory subunit 7
MPPEIPLRSQIDRLTRNHVVNISREQDLSKVIYLNLFNNKLRKIEGIKALVNLETLILAFNEIDMIEGLECNPLLKKLDLGHNFIRKIEHLDHSS